jgi:hypothetical protein
MYFSLVIGLINPAHFEGKMAEEGREYQAKNEGKRT